VQFGRKVSVRSARRTIVAVAEAKTAVVVRVLVKTKEVYVTAHDSVAGKFERCLTSPSFCTTASESLHHNLVWQRCKWRERCWRGRPGGWATLPPPKRKPLNFRVPDPAVFEGSGFRCNLALDVRWNSYLGARSNVHADSPTTRSTAARSARQ